MNDHPVGAPPGPELQDGGIDPRWYRDLVESAPDATVMIDSAGRIMLVNAQTERLFGYARKELLGQKVEVLIPQRYRGKHTVHRDSYFGEPKIREMGAGLELWGLRRDGSEFPVEISLSPLRTDSGVYGTASIRDISDRKKAQNQFRALLESAPDAMVIIDQGGEIRLVNAQAERLFGYQRNEMVGQTVELLVPERLRGKHVEHRAGYFTDPKVRGMGAGLRLWGLRKDGSEFPIEISLSPMETGEGMYATAAVRDITERKAAETLLAEYAENLERSNKELEQFAYVASHDLQAPLRGVIGFSELLQRQYGGKLDQDGNDFLQHIVQSAVHMQALIAGLLELSRVGQQADPFVPTELEQVLAEVESQLSVIVQERGAQISHDPLPVVSGSPVELNHLLQNLIDNAIKFQPGAQPKVHISAKRDGGNWTISVRDQGIGIERRHFDRIFEIFQRLHTTRDYQGTGIGLAICQKIVHHHGGRIWVESEPGKGTTFYFNLKAAGPGRLEAP